MKLKKKLISVLTAGALAVCLTACGAEEDPSSGKSPSTSKKYTIGICQLLEHEALDSATKGFKDALTENSAKIMLILMSRMPRASLQTALPSAITLSQIMLT